MKTIFKKDCSDLKLTREIGTDGGLILVVQLSDPQKAPEETINPAGISTTTGETHFN